jgi:hypothetical protein
MNESKRIKKAYAAGSQAIIGILGPEASREELLDVIGLMAHSVLTGNLRLDEGLSIHNAAVFSARLVELVEATQKGIKNDGQCGRLM